MSAAAVAGLPIAEPMEFRGGPGQEPPVGNHPELLTLHICPGCRVRSLGSVAMHADGCSQPTPTRLLYRLTDRCPDCSGMGTWSDLDCPTCLGSGRLRNQGSE